MQDCPCIGPRAKISKYLLFVDGQALVVPRRPGGGELRMTAGLAGRVALVTGSAGGRGGSIVITSSTAGLLGLKSLAAGSLAYSASKRGVVALMQSLARTLAG